MPNALWERIALDAGVAVSLPRKLVYGERSNPRVLTIQPLIDYFDGVDKGTRVLPASDSESAQRALDQELRNQVAASHSEGDNLRATS